MNVAPPTVVRRWRLSLPYRTNAVALGTACDFANVIPFSANLSRNSAAFKSGRVARALVINEASVSGIVAGTHARLNVSGSAGERPDNVRISVTERQGQHALRRHRGRKERLRIAEPPSGQTITRCAGPQSDRFGRLDGPAAMQPERSLGSDWRRPPSKSTDCAQSR